MTTDQEAIVRMYLDRGYLDAEIVWELTHGSADPHFIREWSEAVADVRRRGDAGHALPDEPTRDDILDLRRRWQVGGDSWPAVVKDALTSEAAVMRWRHRLHLVPWPDGYESKLTPPTPV